MTGDDLQAFANQQKISLKGITIPDGVLPKQTVMGILKKAAASQLTGGNIAKEPAPSAGGTAPAAQGSGQQGGGVLDKAIGALQGATGKSGANNTPSNSTASADEPGSKAQNAQPSNVKTLKNKDGIPPNIQNMLDQLTPTEKKALAGVQLPIASFRGSGLAWMVDILSGVLTGGNHAGRVKDPFDDFSGPQNIGHLFITFKADLFEKNYNQRIKDNIKTIKKLPKIKGVKEIMYPGQNKFFRYKKNLKKEISIPDVIKKDLETLVG